LEFFSSSVFIVNERPQGRPPISCRKGPDCSEVLLLSASVNECEPKLQVAPLSLLHSGRSVVDSSFTGPHRLQRVVPLEEKHSIIVSLLGLKFFGKSFIRNAILKFNLVWSRLSGILLNEQPPPAPLNDCTKLSEQFFVLKFHEHDFTMSEQLWVA
jgi:hypothetical protein